VPDDVPVDQPARELTDPPAAERWFWLWYLYVAAAYIGVLVLLFLDDGADDTARSASFTLLTASVLVYAVFGRRATLEELSPRSTWLFVGVLLALFTAAVLVATVCSFAMFWLNPILFMALPFRSAMLVVLVINLLPALSGVLHDGDPSGVFTQLAPMAVLTIALSVFTSLWIERIINQSSQRALLIEELEASRAEVARLSHEAGVAAERARLAGEIHDTLAQGFTSIITLTQAAESELDDGHVKARKHLDLAARTARDNLAESRALVAALAPFALGAGSLQESVRRQVVRLAEETGVAAEFRAEGEPRPLATAIEVVLLRAAQEALTNVRRHAGASQVRVTLAFAETTVRLTVCDDGAGHDPDVPTDGFGLRGMRARVEQVAGTLTVRGEPGEGTTLDVEVSG
jgi:signal transduction histidine kinase